MSGYESKATTIRLKRAVGFFTCVFLICFSVTLFGGDDNGYMKDLEDKLEKVAKINQMKEFIKAHDKFLDFLEKNKSKLNAGSESPEEEKIKKVITFLAESKGFLVNMPSGRQKFEKTREILEKHKKVQSIFRDFKRGFEEKKISEIPSLDICTSVQAFSVFLGGYKKNLLELVDAQNKEFEWAHRVSKLIGFIKRHKKVNPWEFKLGTGFVGHKSGKGESKKELYKINLFTDLKCNEYPNVINFKSDTMIQLSEGKLTEDVNKLELNYGYSIDTWLEIHGFISRSSNSYLSILHRYEVGAGVSLQLDLFSKNRQDLYRVGDYQDNLDSIDQFEDHIKKQRQYSDTDRYDTRDKIKKLRREGKRIWEAKKRRYSSVTAGGKFFIMSEIEKAEITSDIEVDTGEVDDEGNAIKTITSGATYNLDAKQDFKIVAEPFFIYRTRHHFTLECRWRFIIALSERKPGERRDSRNIITASAGFTLPFKSKWIKKATLSLGFQREYDFNPPRIPADMVDGGYGPYDDVVGGKSVIIYGDDDKNTILSPKAQESYDKYSMSLAISF